MTDGSHDPFDPGGENPWQTLSTNVVYDNGRLRLREDQVIQPDGSPGSYTFIEIPWPVVAVVPLAPNGHYARDGAEGDLIVRAVPLTAAIQAASDGRIVHAITVAGLLRAARHL